MISITGLKKSFGALTVLRDLHLEIPDGQVTGIVGPNGSGKTTTIKTLLGLVKPDTGRIVVNGNVLNGNCEYRREIGYMPQVGRYPDNMTVRELLEFIKEMREGEASNEDELVSYFGLIPELDKKMRTLSGGTRQKVGAVLAMMFDPKILILDEPTAGLDPQASIKFKKLVHQEKKNGKTILLTTHIMSEIEELANYLVFIVEGQIRYEGPMLELMNNQKEERLEGAIAKLMEEVAA